MKIRWFVVIATAFLVLWFKQDSLKSSLAEFAEQAGIVRRLDENTISHSYLVMRDAWLVFSLPARCESLRVLTNANFRRESIMPGDSTQEQQAEWKYSLEYELLDGSNNSLAKSQFHFRARPNQYRDPLTNETCTPSFYADKDVTPTKSNELRIPLFRVSTRARRVRIRLLDADTQVTDVALRFYAEEERPPYKLKQLWQRTSTSRREWLSRASVYTPDLLSESEQRNLLRRTWTPIAPKGIEGRDYQRRILYTLKHFCGVDAGPAEMPNGQLVSSKTNGVIPLPRQAGQIRLACEVAPGHAASDIPLIVRWFGEALHERRTHRFVVKTQASSFTISASGGLLEVACSSPMAIRSFWSPCQGDADVREITPEPSIVRTYKTGGASLEYQISHIDKQPTPLRVDVRQLLVDMDEKNVDLDSVQPTLDTPGLHWQFVDQDGGVVRSGVITPGEQCSRYDRLAASENLSGKISDASKYYFSAPAGVTAICFQGRAGLLVNCYTRPPELPRQTPVPSDSVFQQRDGRQRSWFLLRPSGHRQILNEQGAELLLTQGRPPVDDPMLVAGRYCWQSLEPEEFTTGRFVMLPRDREAATRSNAAASTFTQVTANRQLKLRFLTDPGERIAQTSLIYKRAHTRPSRLTIYVNGQRHQQIKLAGRCGEVRLDPLPLGPGGAAEAFIEAEDGLQLLISKLDMPDQQRYLKRFAYRIDERAVRFRFNKRTAGEELLVLQAFKSAGQPIERWTVTIRPTAERSMGPHQGWTITRRWFDLQPATSPSAFVLGNQAQLVADDYRCFLQLGEDLPPGELEICVSRQATDESYVVLSKTTPGDFEDRRLFTEPHLELSNLREGLGR